MKLFFYISALSLPALVLACGGANPSENKSGTSTKQADSVAELGDSCGGFVAHPVHCDGANNLYCNFNGIGPDRPGVCTSCDGYGALPRTSMVCGDGNTYSAQWVGTPDGLSCVIQVCPPGLDPGTGGSANNCPSNASWDSTNQVCVCNDSTATWDPNSNTCQPQAAQCQAIWECVVGKHFDRTQCACVANQNCGGLAGIQCPDGQTCTYDNNFPDAPGYCVPSM